MTLRQSLMSRVFGPKNYRVISEKTGPGVEWTHHTRWGAALTATYYEWLEWWVGLPDDMRQNWHVQRKAG